MNVNEKLKDVEHKLEEMRAQAREAAKYQQTVGSGGRIKFEGVDYIPTKTAALEAYKIHQGSRNVAIVGIASVLVIGIFGAFNVWLGSGAAGIIAMGFALFLFKDTSRMKYLISAYGLDVKKLKN